jgi:PAS domain S-box-containing protein
MVLQFSLLATGLLLSGVLSGLVAVFLLGERPRSGATSLALVEVTLAGWGIGQALAIAGTSAQLQLFGHYLTLCSTGFIGPALLVFALQYTGREEYVSRPRLAVLGIEPIFVTALAVWNPSGVLYADLSTTGGAVAFDPGIGLLAHVAYIYVLLGVGDYFLFRKFLASRNVYRKRSFFFLLYSVLLTIGHAASILEVSPTPELSLTPLLNLVFASLSLLVFVGFRTYDFLPLQPVMRLFGSRSKNLAPVARDTLIEEMGGGMIVLDHKNRIVDINPMGRRILGRTDDRVVGKPLESVLPEAVFEDEYPPFFDPDATGTYSAIWVHPPMGEPRCFDARITRLDDEDGAGGRVALVHDVTDRERRKQMLEERTTELERQNDQLDSFASIVSHDLRNPLSVAQSATELTRHKEDLGELDRVDDAHERMGEIIDDVLTLARQGQTVEETESASLADVAAEAWGHVDSTAATLDVVDDLQIEADRNRLLRVFENLFRNAIEHGRDDVAVTVGALTDGFYVEDDGPGIPPESRDEVLEQGMTTSDQGTGFGLAIVATVADAHGWAVTVTESDEGGARFEFAGTDHQPDRSIDDSTVV